MPAPLRIQLTPEEDNTLFELSYASTIPKRTKQRVMALRLNAQGFSVRDIAEYLDWAEQTVRQTIQRWKEGGLIGLWEAPGRGKKACWSSEDWQAVEQWLLEERRYRQGQISQKLASERNIVLGQEQVRRVVHSTPPSYS
ncbi:helix-turn-helix domain-containing protein [Scytonema tolypothrichoides VB-61278]|nr:helix-turn-helix domain-containing protein [Scytonema tolypothrichoides VB-61278]